MPSAEQFQIDRDRHMLIFTPVKNLSELENIDSISRELTDHLADIAIKNLVMDFHNTDYFGSSTLVLFVKLWKMMQERHGKMAFCNLSSHEKEILQITKLDSYWPICATLDEAMKAIEL